MTNSTGAASPTPAEAAARAEAARLRADAARSFLRSRRRRVRPTAYQLYTAVVVGAIAGALGHGLITNLIGGGLSLDALALFGPATLLLVLLAAARFGSWQGPVSFSAADVSLLLTAPIASEELVRPKLDQAMLAGAAIGAAIGAGVILVLAGGPAGLGLGRAIAGVAGVSALSLLATAVSWLVQSSRTVTQRLRRASLVVVGGAVGVVLLEATVGHSVGIWSGPWGWALAPVVGQAAWPLATGALVIAAISAALYARHRAGSASIESFLVRAGTRSALTAGVYTLDYRGAALTYRAAQPETRGWRMAVSRRGRFAVPRPRRAALAILWRDAVAMTRNPSRFMWAAALAAAATIEALTHPGRLLPAGLAATGIYFAASLLIEPLRVDVDYPDRSATLLSWSFARVQRAHRTLPFVALVTTIATTILLAVVFGLGGPALLLLLPTALCPLAGVAVFASARAARRGGRIDQDLLGQLMTTDPSNPGSIIIFTLLLAPWLIATVVVLGGVIAIIGHH